MNALADKYRIAYEHVSKELSAAHAEVKRLREALEGLLPAYVSLHKAHWNQERNPVEQMPNVIAARAALRPAPESKEPTALEGNTDA
jgi:hypothetical protein